MRAPNFKEWPDVVAQNVALQGRYVSAILSEQASLRREVVEAACKHTLQLQKLAEDRGIELPSQALPERVEGWSGPIIMSGHQPVVYHEGLMEKERALGELVDAVSGLGIHVVIDTDLGDGGRLLFPQVADGMLRLSEATLASSEGLYLGQRLKSTEELTRVCGMVERSLDAVGVQYPKEVFLRASRSYSQLGGALVGDAHSIVRWSLFGRTHLEIPFSRLVQLPEVRKIIASWVEDGTAFSRAYNSVLDRYRTEHKIKNTANPFPNVEVSERGYELPLWIVSADSSERRPVRVLANSALELNAGEFLASRGSLTTLLLRGWCSDLFIHGRGGARYDPLVDQFAEQYLERKLPQFVVASADAYLFRDGCREVTRAEFVKDQYKQIVSHTERFFEELPFTSEERAELSRLSVLRGEFLEELGGAKEAASKSTASHKLNQLNRDIREILDSGTVGQVLKVLSYPEAHLAALRCREYPFFLCGHDYI